MLMCHRVRADLLFVLEQGARSHVKRATLPPQNGGTERS